MMLSSSNLTKSTISNIPIAFPQMQSLSGYPCSKRAAWNPRKNLTVRGSSIVLRSAEAVIGESGGG